jgi:membrane protein implicated in regulation of membrane protease activity
MAQWFAELDTLQKVFFACALFGTVFFVVRLIIQFIGLESHGVADDVPDIMPDAPQDLHAVGDSDLSFKLVTIQGVTAFFMLFGLTGMALKAMQATGDVQAILIAAGAGCAMTYVQAKFMGMLFKLQSSGNLNLHHAIGQEGVIYLTIRAGASGRAQVSVQGRRKIFDAVSRDRGEIKTGERVRVTDVSQGNVLVVERIA